jgi:ABC-type branched-subunit amino acid transport system ATPase component
VKNFTIKKINDIISKNKMLGGIFVIEVKNVTKKYGKLTAVDNISFKINEGEIIGLLRTKWSWKKYNNEYVNRIHRTNRGSNTNRRI